MNDLQTLRAALTPDEPDQDVIDRSRHLLQNRIYGGRPGRKRIGWLTVGVGLTAAAAAVAISVVPTEGPSPVDNGSPVKTVTGKDVLLAAATAAEQAPETPGTYWHVKFAGVDGSMFESWTGLDGDMHVWSGVDGQLVISTAGFEKPFALLGAELTMDELRALPTEPEALKSAIREAIRNGGAGTSEGAYRDLPEAAEEAT